MYYQKNKEGCGHPVLRWMMDNIYIRTDPAGNIKADKEKFNELKTQYNGLIPEHNTFLKKQTAAQSYIRTVHNYLEKQRQQERDRQYKERKRTQQRKNDVLE